MAVDTIERQAGVRVDPPVRLSEFIDRAKQEIVAESVTYAAELPVLSGQAIEALRDHLPLVLDAIARDLEQPQTRAQSIVKSEGRAPIPRRETAAQTHGLLRARSGLTAEQLVAEYRVLRSSVLRLWADASGPSPHAVADTLRFNEAIDQAVAESVDFFSAEVDRWRGLFLGVLGHDLRGPLAAILMTAQLLAKTAEKREVSAPATAILRNARHMQTLLDSLLEYSRSELGMPMAIQRAEADLASVCDEEADLLRAALPGVDIALDIRGDANGSFDAVRIREAVANLVFNAVQHGVSNTAIAITVTGRDDDVQVSVENESEPVPVEILENLFEPLRRHATDGSGSGRNLGLGLFIVREIARAHEGEVAVSMVGRRVAFTMTLPRAQVMIAKAPK
jgi:signal transduction histidine kinase